MNFDKLPCDIKRKIFDCNRAEAVLQRKAVERSKDKFNKVVNDFNNMCETVFWNYYADRDEDGWADTMTEPDPDFDFANAFINEFEF